MRWDEAELAEIVLDRAFHVVHRQQWVTMQILTHVSCYQSAVLIVVNRLQDFSLCIHHEWAVPRHWLVGRFTRQ